MSELNTFPGLQEEFRRTELLGQRWPPHVQEPRPLNIVENTIYNNCDVNKFDAKPSPRGEGLSFLCQLPNT